jgi:predicted CoA-binding protein
MTGDDSLRDILTRCRRIAVVGLSPKPHRESFGVARYLLAAGYQVVPVNPQAAGQLILGQLCWASLAQAAAQAPVDLVNVFRNADDVPPVAEDAIAIGAQVLWLQLGIRHDACALKAQAAGLQVVQDRCIKIDHARLLRFL